MYTSVVWLPKGAAKQNPEQYVPTDADKAALMSRIQSASEAPVSVSTTSTVTTQSDAPATPAETDPDLQELNMDAYDDEEDLPCISGGFIDPQDDPYMTIKEDDEDEIIDHSINPTASVLLATKADAQVSQLEVHVREQTGTFDSHHEVFPGVLPTCCAWGPTCRIGAQVQRGSFAAVGTFSPDITIWDMDLLDAVEPVAALTHPAARPAPPPLSLARKRRNKKKKRAQQAAPEMPTATLALSWNTHMPQLLASGSSDHAVRVWDVNRMTCLDTALVESEVNALQWHPTRPSILAAGDMKGNVAIFDASRGLSKGPIARASVGGRGVEIESLAWDPHHDARLLVSCSNGSVYCYESQPTGARLLWQLAAHQGGEDNAVSAIAICPHLAGLLVTGGHDDQLKVWDVRDPHDLALLSARDIDVGPVLSLCFAPDEPGLLAIGGARRLLASDTRQWPFVQQRWAGDKARQ
eukprot:gnl/Trimastix_PCT/1263.p1 GENE.gnl/Trimastix_PCT/1263~~gnl/Trimastix_PCT/1263.p1  ORF type:complete len:467 (-),score=156.83 gnl/Trimastix_PCT/1263:52-1452(-)